jgi:hypothetical protein
MDRLAKHRSRHVIYADRDLSEDEGTWIYRCRWCHIRVIAQHGIWVHDQDEVKGLEKLERGEALAW